MIRQQQSTRGFGEIVGASPAMKATFEYLAKAAKVAVPVVITGETGTGKELAAWEIHRRSNRANGPFVPVNTGVLSKELVASELFGHTKGAFTGADTSRLGRFAEADGGTLFLDEITTMTESTQVALLRVLDAGVYRPVGGQHDLSADVRLIAATNMNLYDAVREGHFREDLLHRLEVVHVDLPPLRDRIDDVPMLAHHFMNKLADVTGAGIDDISGESIEYMMDYSWPGNVRELKNAVAESMVMAETGIVQPRHLPRRITEGRGAFDSTYSRTGLHQLEQIQNNAAMRSSFHPLGEAGEDRPVDGVFLPLGSTLEEIQRTYVMKILAASSNNKTHAARTLGISRKTLHDKLQRWTTPS